MQTFIEKLKNIISEVKNNGGSVIEHTAVPSNIYLELRKFAFKLLEDNPNHRNLEFFLDDLYEGIFDESNRLLYIYLKKLGIEDNEKIVSTIKDVLKQEFVNPVFIDRKDFQYSLAYNLCVVWEEEGEEVSRNYKFVNERAFIIFYRGINRWLRTNLTF